LRIRAAVNLEANPGYLHRASLGATARCLPWSTGTSPSSKCSRSGNVDEKECVSGKFLIHALDFYCHVNDIFRLGFLTSLAIRYSRPSWPTNLLSVQNSEIADSVSLASVLLSKVRALISRGLHLH
jgi:hypothetical protein